MSENRTDTPGKEKRFTKSDKNFVKKEGKKDLFDEDIHRALPHSYDAEMGVLSSMMQNPDELIGDAMTKLTPEHFHSPGNRAVFEMMVELHDKQQKAVDAITLTTALNDRGQLESAGGASAITQLITFVPHAGHFQYYLEIIHEKLLLRSVIKQCTSCIERAYDEPENVNHLIDQIERDVLAIREDPTKGFATMKDEVLDAIKAIDQIFKNKGALSGLPTGFKEFDEMTNGLHGGEMVIIAARPSMGKTSLAMNIVENIAVGEKKPVAVFSLEMSTQQLVQRLLCSRAGINMQKLRSGFLSKQHDFPKLMSTAGKLAESPIFIDDTSGLSIGEMRAKARRLKQKQEIELIMIDYLQLMTAKSGAGKDNRQLEIAEISAGVKGIAKELNIPVIVLAQLNRNPEQRGGGRPRLSDLRESGSIEQDADVVGLLVREEYYADGDEEVKENTAGKATLIIAKQRNGPTGDVGLAFDNKLMRFRDRVPGEFGDDE